MMVFIDGNREISKFILWAKKAREAPLLSFDHGGAYKAFLELVDRSTSLL
jgi:hypothetical protein